MKDAHTEVLEHSAYCWGKDGPGYEMREAVQELRTWVKGIGIALVILQLLSVGGTVAKWFSPTTARAEAVSK